MSSGRVETFLDSPCTLLLDNGVPSTASTSPASINSKSFSTLGDLRSSKTTVYGENIAAGGEGVADAELSRQEFRNLNLKQIFEVWKCLPSVVMVRDLELYIADSGTLQVDIADGRHSMECPPAQA